MQSKGKERKERKGTVEKRAGRIKRSKESGARSLQLYGGKAAQKCNECSNLIEVRGTQICTTTAENQIYCWYLVVGNNTGVTLKNVQLLLDIQSFQTNLPFAPGPGIFGTILYSMDTGDVAGTPNPGYAGAGLFFTASSLVVGEHAFTLCTIFSLSFSAIANTQLLPSSFSVVPQPMNIPGCGPLPNRSMVYVQPFNNCEDQVQCPTFVEWSSADSFGPEPPCESCTNGVVQFAINAVTGCVSSVCIGGVWSCLGTMCTGEIIPLFTFQNSDEGFLYQLLAGPPPTPAPSWTGSSDGEDWLGNLFSTFNVPIAPPGNGYTNYLLGEDSGPSTTYTTKTFTPAEDWSLYFGRFITWEVCCARPNLTPDATYASNPQQLNLRSGGTTLTGGFFITPELLIDGLWQTVSCALTGANFSTTDQALYDVLLSLDEIQIKVEFITPATDQFGLSYIRITCDDQTSTECNGTVTIATFESSAENWLYTNDVLTGESWTSNEFDWLGEPFADITVPFVGPPGGYGAWLSGFDTAALTFAIRTFSPTVDWSHYMGRYITWDAFALNNNDSPASNYRASATIQLTSGTATTASTLFIPNASILSQGLWQTISVNLAGAVWGVTDGALAAILADLAELRIQVELIINILEDQEVSGMSWPRITCTDESNP